MDITGKCGQMLKKPKKLDVWKSKYVTNLWMWSSWWGFLEGYLSIDTYFLQYFSSLLRTACWSFLVSPLCISGAMWLVNIVRERVYGFVGEPYYVQYLIRTLTVPILWFNLGNLMQISVKFWEKRKSDENSNRTWEIFCDFEEIFSKL